MGRIRTKTVKRVTHRLLLEHKGEFSEDFAKNKELVKSFIVVQSPKLGNIVAGYLTKLVKAGNRK